MSSTNRGAVRDLDDYYATPPDLARLICARLAQDLSDDPRDVVNVLEPGCGGGSFLVAARDTWPNAVLHGYELNPELAEKARSKGFNVHSSDVLTAKLADYHVIVGNPPFKHAEQFIHKLTPRLDPESGFLAFVLRLNFFGGAARYASLWAKHIPERIYILPVRAGFTPDGRSDSVEYMVAVFRNPSCDTDATTLHHLDNRHVANRWAPGKYEDPRKGWFPSDAPRGPPVDHGIAGLALRDPGPPGRNPARRTLEAEAEAEPDAEP